MVMEAITKNMLIIVIIEESFIWLWNSLNEVISIH